MAPPNATDLRQDLYWTLWGAGRDLGFCLLAFPISTFSGALLLGLLGSLPQMRHPSLAPAWIIGLGLSALFSVWAVFSVRSACRGLAKAGMPPHEVRRRIAVLWNRVAVLMLGEGICTLGYLAITFDPDRMGSITVFGPLDRPLPLVIALTLYVMAGALLLGRSWKETREAKNTLALHAGGSQEADEAAAWTRDIGFYTARSNGGIVVMLFVIETLFLALLIASGDSGPGKWESSRLLLMSLFAFGSVLSVLAARRVRRHFEAAGLSREEVRQEMAAIWRLGGFLMIMIGAAALAFVFLAFDLLNTAESLWMLGTASVYTLIGVLLLWRNWGRGGDGRAASVLLLLLLTGLSVPPAWPADPSTASTTLALVGGTIYTAPHVAPIFDGVVIIAEGKVVAVGPRKEVEVPAGAQTLECRGLVVTAGFQNSHVHFTEEKWNDAARQAPGKLAAQLTEMLTRYGFTTVVDTASPLENTAALRRRIEAGEVAGPRILTAGDGIYPPDGIPFYLKEGPGKLPDDYLGRLSQPASPEESTAVARQRIGGGADLVKLFTGSWVARGKVLPMPEEIASAAAVEAHHQGKLAFSHPSNLAGLEVALRANVDVLAHAIEDTRGMTAEHTRRMREQGMGLIPTLTLFARDRYLFEILDEVRDYARSGGLILFGTDVGYLTDYDPSMEYALMESAGLGWREVLASLTTHPAARFGEASRRGRIARGMEADLVVLARDPVTDVRAFADVRYTLRAGKVIYSAEAGAP